MSRLRRWQVFAEIEANLTPHTDRAARTASLAATLEHLAWFKIPHTLDQIVGLHLEALGTGTMAFRYGATPAEMAATMKARAENGPAGRIGPPDPGTTSRTAATHETLLGIDTTVADLAAYGRRLDDLCSQTLGLELRPLHPNRTRQDAVAEAVTAIIHARPNIEPAADALPAHEVGFLDDLIRCHLASAADWLHGKALAIWDASHGEQQAVAVQRTIVECRLCSSWRKDTVATSRGRCTQCATFQDHHKVKPTEAIVRRWEATGRADTPPGLILDAKATRRKAG